MLLIYPEEFLIITIAAFIFVIITGLIICLIPCRFPNIPQLSSRKRKQSDCVAITQKDAFSSCPNGCCVGVIDNKDSKPSSITGPQGHGFYTSGPWRVDPGIHTDINFGHFQNTELMMGAEYFASMMNQSVPEEETPNHNVEHHFHEMNDDDDEDISQDFAMMDMSQNDTDMVMMIF